MWYSRFLNAPECSEKLVKPTMSVLERAPRNAARMDDNPMHGLAPPKDQSYRDIVSGRSLLAST